MNQPACPLCETYTIYCKNDSNMLCEKGENGWALATASTHRDTEDR